MFDEILRELRRMPKTFTIPIELPLDEKGYLDRACHQRECTCQFKVMEQDWINKVRDEAAFCPKCGGASPADEFNTEAQQRFIKKVGERFAAEQLDKTMKRAIRRTRPQKVSAGLFNIEMTLSYTSERVQRPIAHKANEVLRQDFECSECNCRYSTIGAGYFCPACGHNSAERDFAQTVETTLRAVDLLGQIKATVIEHADADVAEDLQQQMMKVKSKIS